MSSPQRRRYRSRRDSVGITRWNPRTRRREHQPLTPSGKAVAGAAKPAEILQEPDASSSKLFTDDIASEESITASRSQKVLHNANESSSSASLSMHEKLVAGAVESVSGLTLQEPDVSSLDEFLDSSSQESITASPPTVPHNANDESSSTFKLVAGAAKSASTLQEPDGSSLDEFLDSSSDESFTARPRTAQHNTNDSSPPLVSPFRSKIFFRYIPNWYHAYYVRRDCKGSFHMYPDLDGPFQSVDEADAAINRYLSELQCRARCKEQDKLSIVDRMVDECMYYLDGTPKKGPNSPASKDVYSDTRHLIRALLGQYNENHNLFGSLAHELKDIVRQQWIYEGDRSYYHYNFTTKKESTVTVNLFFAEVSHMHRERSWEWQVNCCCVIETEDNGHCYGCINNGSPGMRHPNSTDAFWGGTIDGYLPFDCLEYSDNDEEAEERRLRSMFEGLDDPDEWESIFPSNGVF